MMKEMNKNLIRNIFKTELEITAAQLSRKTELSVVTVNSLLKEMIESNEVYAGESIPSNGGRPSTVYKYNDMFRCSAIIFGYTIDNKNYIKVLVTNLLGKCIYEETSIYEEIKDDSFDIVLDKLFKKYTTIEVITFGLPGAEDSGVITLNDYTHIIGDTFINHYKERYKVPVIFVNDINAAVNGYYHSKLDNNKVQNVVGLVFNRVYLPGAGVVINGEIYTGKSNFAGEICNMPLGIDWLKLDYHNHQEISDAIGKLVAAISCVIAPDNFIIYGDFFNDESENLIKANSDKLLNNLFEVNLTTSNKFEEDYELGMIKSALEVLNNKDEI